ncbi:hypothetical protein RAA17_16775 [Komagataeibacter rhaeticus]|nr:hypothetical protein [Komagataeibacter rhaeticus]
MNPTTYRTLDAAAIRALVAGLPAIASRLGAARTVAGARGQ